MPFRKSWFAHSFSLPEKKLKPSISLRFNAPVTFAPDTNALQPNRSVFQKTEEPDLPIDSRTEVFDFWILFGPFIEKNQSRCKGV